MCWVNRIFTNAAACHFAAVVIAIALAVAASSAQAQSSLYVSFASEGEAYSACMTDSRVAYQRAKVVNPSYADMYNQPSCPKVTGPNPYYDCIVRNRWSGNLDYMCRDNTKRYYQYPGDETCAKKPAQSTLFVPPGGSTRCNGGCEAKYTWMGADATGKETSMANYTGAVCDPNRAKDECNAKNPGGTTPPSWVWNGYLGVCQPITTECPAGQSASPDGKCKNNDDCPVTHVLNASGVCVKKDEDCAPGTIRGLDGLCKQDDDRDKSKCGVGMAKGKDGTCKVDQNNDGIPDSDQDPNDPKNNKDGKQFSGGDNCNVPPNCAGDPIMCGQARIQWRIECNTRKAANISGGVCGSIPICTGEGCKPMEYSQLVMQWRTACAVEELARKGLGENGNGTGSTPVPDTSGVGDGQLEGAIGANGEGDPSSAFTDGSEGGQPGGVPGGVPGSNGLDTQGFGWSRSCPAAPTIDLMGQAITFNLTPFCNWMALGGWLVMIMAALLSVRIMSSAGSA